jgi:glycosyltransferase involved in cell wall biosynthesis
MKKIKILRIIARLNIGGPAIHTILLTEGLDKNKFESLLVCGSVGDSEADMLYYAIEKGVKPYFVPELKRELNLLNDIRAFRKIYNIINTERPDIIHTHTAKAGTLGRLAAIFYNLLNRDRQLSFVHTFHGHIFDGYFGNLKTKVFILIERFLAFFTHKIITVSESIKNDLVVLGISSHRIEVIPLGFELDRFLNICPRDNSAVNIGIVGRLVPVKNHRLFLEAAAEVIKSISKNKPRFKIIGDGELRNELERYAHKLNINTYVEFLGWQKEPSAIYSDLDVVCLTSVNEGTPVSLIEAMASGRAVVTTDVGGVRDLLGNEVEIVSAIDTSFKILKRGIMVGPADSHRVLLLH